MAARRSLKPGARVRIKGRPIAVDLDADTGFVARPDVWDGYYIIHLDRPARHHNADGTIETLPEIREAWDNLELVPAAKPEKKATGVERPG